MLSTLLQNESQISHALRLQIQLFWMPMFSPDALGNL